MRFAKILIGLLLFGAIAVVFSSWQATPSVARSDGATHVAAAAQTSAEKALDLSFDLLLQTKVNDKPPPTFPKSLLEMEGQRVRIAGFVVPYDDPQNMYKLLVVKSPIGCFFCNPPDINAVVFVRRLPKSPALDLNAQPMAFEGTLHLWRSDIKNDDDASQFLFTLDDATAVFAR